MSAHEEIIRALREHRLDCEREKRAQAIQAAFEKVRELPVDAPPPKTIQAELLVTETITEPPPRPLQPLTDVAAPLLARLASTPMLRRRPDKAVWDIDTVPTETPEQLFGDALASLGFAPALPAEQTVVQQKSIWKRRQR
jgi:hypothetical protein